MKKIFYLLFLLPLLSTAQQTTHNVSHGGANRSYIRYVPTVYDPNVQTPVVFALHGLGDNMNNFTGIGMHALANINNFIVITPQALTDPLLQSSAWNSGGGAFGVQLNANVDDVGFILSILDSLQANFNIDSNRVYSCGFSMGGFMSHRLACESNGKIAAIASVAGTIGTYNNCSPTQAVPVIHFHGTADGTVGYATNSFGMDAEATAEFWANNNGCDVQNGPDTTYLPDVANDGYTIEHFRYNSCDPNGAVELVKVIGADHVWLGPNNDIFYTEEIWKFFSRGTILATPDREALLDFSLAPNPTQHRTRVSFTLEAPERVRLRLFDLQGRQVKELSLAGASGNNEVEIELSDLAKGMYSLQISAEGWSFHKSLLKMN